MSTHGLLHNTHLPIYFQPVTWLSARAHSVVSCRQSKGVVVCGFRLASMVLLYASNTKVLLSVLPEAGLDTHAAVAGC